MGFCFAVQLLSISALLTLAVDRLVAVSFPCWYTTIRSWVPIFFASVLGATISIPFMALSILSLEPDHKIPVCSEGTALPESLQSYGNLIFMGINLSIIAIYCAAYLILFWRSRMGRRETDHAVSTSLRIHEKAMKSIAIFVFVFCFSWFLSKILASQLRMVESSVSPVVFVLKLIMICSISFSYSHCYYVYFFTSRDYRAAFLEQLHYPNALKIFVTTNVVVSSRANLNGGQVGGQ
uniref:G_PROTEIN_RECEP_F1_2 domain-containing protein n=1 Tax=Steinernema glaseri TaxID=37863 RepID=A0A1I7Z4V3_9BILA